jgi:hypothetical protein
LHVHEPRYRYIFMMASGAVYTVTGPWDGSTLRESVLKHTGEDRIAGVSDPVPDGYLT